MHFLSVFEDLSIYTRWASMYRNLLIYTCRLEDLSKHTCCANVFKDWLYTHTMQMCLKTDLYTHTMQTCLKTVLYTHAGLASLKTCLYTHAGLARLKTCLNTNAVQTCLKTCLYTHMMGNRV